MSARIRTGYSFRSAVGRVEHVLDRLQEIGSAVAPITDTASTFGWVKWGKLCKKRGLRPVFGVELAVTRSIHAKKPSSDHWTFIAQGDLAPLHNLISLATSQFRYQPLLTVEQACAEAGVSVIMGHRSQIAEIAALPHLYVGVGPSVTPGYLRRGFEAGHKPIAVSDNRYPAEGGLGLYETICGRGASTQSYPQWIMSDEEWLGDMAERLGPNTVDLLADALKNRDAVLELSTATIQPATMVSPPRPDTLRNMCIAGARKLGVDLDNGVYAARLDRELQLISDKEFEDYFYLVADICQWARERMIVGPARGSSCGSLVCYLLEITTIDPIPHGLIFERFIDLNRSDLPDIDIDFSDTKRHMVFEYVAQKYGKDHVARLGTVAFYQPRSALKESAGALDIPQWKVDPVMDAIIERSSGDARALQATEDTLRDTPAGRALLDEYPEILVAGQMEGHPRHYSQHAAGIVITDKPVSEYVAVDARTGATMCDKKDAEDLNLLKIDALGLTQLSIFEDALELAGLHRDHLFGVPLDDPAAFDVLNAQKFSGIFQFNGLALQYISSSIKVADFNDIVAITALARPGPLNSGGTHRWIEIKNGKAPESYPHPLFEPHLKGTLGVVAYQEQVMNIGREIGGLSWEDVTALRKAMSKSLGKEFFDQFGDRWKAGAIAKGIPADVLEKVWDDLCAYGAWAFNLSHALAYGTVSYWCCWLKAHHPLAFAAATLTHADPTKPGEQIKMLREMAAEGVDYVPADMHISTDKWTVGLVDGRKALVGPLSNVKGVGPKMQAAVLSARARNEPLPERARKLLENPKTKIDSLFPIKKRISQILPDPTAKNIYSTPWKIVDLQPNGSERDVLVFAVAENIKPRDENEEANLAKRKGKRIEGKTAYMNLRLMDDTDIIFAKIKRFDFEKLAQPILDRGRPGKAIYAIKGTIPRAFRMISVTNVRYLGDMDLDEDTKEPIAEPATVEPEAEQEEA